MPNTNETNLNTPDGIALLMQDPNSIFYKHVMTTAKLEIRLRREIHKLMEIVMKEEQMKELLKEVQAYRKARAEDKAHPVDQHQEDLFDRYLRERTQELAKEREQLLNELIEIGLQYNDNNQHYQHMLELNKAHDGYNQELVDDLKSRKDDHIAVKLVEMIENGELRPTSENVMAMYFQSVDQSVKEGQLSEEFKKPAREALIGHECVNAQMYTLSDLRQIYYEELKEQKRAKVEAECKNEGREVRRDADGKVSISLDKKGELNTKAFKQARDYDEDTKLTKTATAKLENTLKELFPKDARELFDRHGKNFLTRETIDLQTNTEALAKTLEEKEAEIDKLTNKYDDFMNQVNVSLKGHPQLTPTGKIRDVEEIEVPMNKPTRSA